MVFPLGVRQHQLLLQLSYAPHQRADLLESTKFVEVCGVYCWWRTAWAPANKKKNLIFEQACQFEQSYCDVILFFHPLSIYKYTGFNVALAAEHIFLEQFSL